MEQTWLAYKPKDKEILARLVTSPEVVRTYNCEAVVAQTGMYIVVDDGQTMVMKASKFNNRYTKEQDERED